MHTGHDAITVGFIIMATRHQSSLRIVGKDVIAKDHPPIPQV
jgi:hypothetical protein